MRAKLLRRNRADGTEFENNNRSDENIPPPADHPLMRLSLAMGRNRPAPYSAHWQPRSQKRPRLLTKQD